MFIMAGSKELNKVIKSFLNFCNISAENSTYLETGLLYGESVLFALELNFKKLFLLILIKPSLTKLIKDLKMRLITLKFYSFRETVKKKLKKIITNL